MGHYGVVTAYDDATETVLIQDFIRQGGLLLFLCQSGKVLAGV